MVVVVVGWRELVLGRAEKARPGNGEGTPSIPGGCSEAQRVNATQRAADCGRASLVVAGRGQGVRGAARGGTSVMAVSPRHATLLRAPSSRRRCQPTSRLFVLPSCSKGSHSTSAAANGSAADQPRAFTHLANTPFPLASLAPPPWHHAPPSPASTPRSSPRPLQTAQRATHGRDSTIRTHPSHACLHPNKIYTVSNGDTRVPLLASTASRAVSPALVLQPLHLQATLSSSNCSSRTSTRITMRDITERAQV